MMKYFKKILLTILFSCLLCFPAFAYSLSEYDLESIVSKNETPSRPVLIMYFSDSDGILYYFSGAASPTGYPYYDDIYLITGTSGAYRDLNSITPAGAVSHVQGYATKIDSGKFSYLVYSSVDIYASLGGSVLYEKGFQNSSGGGEGGEGGEGGSVFNYFGILGKIFNSVGSLPSAILDGLLDVAKKLFIPSDFQGSLQKISSLFTAVLGLDSGALDFLQSTGKSLPVISFPNLTYSGGKVVSRGTFEVLDLNCILDADYAPLLNAARGWIWFILLIFNINQALSFINQSQLFLNRALRVGDSGTISKPSKNTHLGRVVDSKFEVIKK